MRLFTAIDLPDDIRTRFADLQAPDQLDAQWSPPHQFHVTIRFIGDTEPEQAARYEDALSEVEAPVVKCSPYGLDVFPNRRNPRVLILGLERSDALMTLYRSVSHALEAEGLDPEDRDYHPHVTLGRLNHVSAATVHDFLDAHRDLSLPSFVADTFILYESTLTADGAVHEKRATIALSS